MPDLDPRSTALVLIDLQRGILGRSTAPHGAQQVLDNGRALAGRCRAAGALVVLVRVEFAHDFADALRQSVDEPMQRPPGGFPPDFAEFGDGLQQPGDLVITKRQWGAFHGTELDLQLRRRGIRSIVLGGIATNFGVESTARQGWELGYELLIAEDACTAVSAELHEMAIRHIFPRISRVTRTQDIRFNAA